MEHIKDSKQFINSKEMTQIEKEITNLNGKLYIIEAMLEKAVWTKEEEDKYGDKKQLRDEKKQLRRKEEQLRRKEEQLREKELLLLRQMEKLQDKQELLLQTQYLPQTILQGKL